MAITEYTNEEVELESGEYAILVNASICTKKIEGTNIVSPHRIVVGTDSEIDQYIVDNSLTYEVIPNSEESE